MEKKSYSIYYVLIFVFLLGSCKVQRLPFVGSSLNIKFQNNKDHTLYFSNIILDAIQNNIDTIFIEEGTYEINNTVYDGILRNDLAIIGIGNVQINVRSRFLYLTSPIIDEFIADKNLLKADKIISHRLTNFEFEKQHLTLFIISDSIIETGWKYKKGELQNIEKVDNKNYYLKDSLLFNYDKNEKAKIRIYDSKKISFSNIHFVVNEKETKWTEEQVIRTDGCRNQLTNVKISNRNKTKQGLFWGMYHCNDIKVENFETTNFIYGLVIDYSKDVYGRKIISNNTQHPIVPATFTQNVKIENVRGYNTCIDAHLAFNVSYDDVDIDTGSDYFNCRSFGVKITNSVFKSSKEINYDGIGIGVSSLTKAYEYLYDEYDVILKNVKWNYPLKLYNGLHIHKCRNFLLDSVETHRVSTGSFIKKFEITNSKLGSLFSYDSNFFVSNSVFDCSLQRLSKCIEPISCSFSGSAKIENCKFINFSNQYLFSYVSSPDSKITFSKCSFSGIDKLVKVFEYPKARYNIFFSNCTFNSKVSVPKELDHIKSSIDNQTLK